MGKNTVIAVAPCFKNVPVYQTRGIQNWIHKDASALVQVSNSLQKFLMLNWGNTCKEDAEINNQNLRICNEIVAIYPTTAGNIYIIADGKCDEIAYSHITILFPGEY